MRTQGKITFWKSDKGYGFITPGPGSKQVFVHINSFTDRQLRPQINQLVTFSMSTDKQGRPCAVDVTRDGEQAPIKIARNARFSSIKSVALFLILVGFLGVFAYSRYQKSQAGLYVPANASESSRLISSPKEPSRFRCDGRTLCSHMTSCAEARYFIQNCPNTKMDGDGDGVPCESQWCD